jgi:hypothetical protein
VLIIVGGVYLDSSGQEQLGVDALNRLTAHITELKQLYGTDTIILTGDFNVTLHASQCHSGRINKPRTSRITRFNDRTQTLRHRTYSW